MCGGGSPKSTPAPAPTAPTAVAELKVADEDTLKKKKRGTSRLKIPLSKSTAPTTGLAVPKVS